MTFYLFDQRANSLMGASPNIKAVTDLGTTKIATIIAEMRSDKPHIIGVNCEPSEGMRQGVVVNIEKMMESIRKSIAGAEQMAGVKINEVDVGIAGDHIRSFLEFGKVTISNAPGPVLSRDVQRAIDAVKAFAIPIDREVLSCEAVDYKLDGQSGIPDPVGLTGTQLEVGVLIVTAEVSSAQNIVRAVSKAGIRVNGIVLEPLASGLAVLNEPEKHIGTAMIDIGGGTSDMAIYYNGSPKDTYVVARGGNDVTSDIFMALGISFAEAERIKKAFGYAFVGAVPDEDIEVKDLDSRKTKLVSRNFLNHVIQARVEEILWLIRQRIDANTYNDHVRNIVLTGGGSLLPGMVELAQEIFQRPVRIGIPENVVTGLENMVRTPIHATGVGLLINKQKAGAPKQPSVHNQTSAFDWVKAQLSANVKEFIEGMK
jgi:cell division protein FtsA